MREVFRVDQKRGEHDTIGLSVCLMSLESVKTVSFRNYVKCENQVEGYGCVWICYVGRNQQLLVFASIGPV